MIKKLLTPFSLCVIVLITISSALLQAADMSERIQTAIDILDKKQHSGEPIPSHVRTRAKGVAIFTLTKGGLVIGGQGGEGIVITRRGANSWTAPSAFNLGGASVGAQIGFTEARYIVFLNTEDAVRQFTSSGKLNWNATATGTIGSASERESANTSNVSQGEVVIYKDTGGIFGGATLGGTSIERKDEINRQAYGDHISLENFVDGTVKAPKSTERLYLLVNGKD